jgi:putative ABC transport system permease protein
MILIAAVLGIVLSVVGLYAYVALIVNRKTKEMGIRKVFGASPRSISFSIFKSLFQWIMIATLSGWAIAYLFSDSWLKNFPYTIELKPWMFLLSALFVGLLAAISVMYKTLQLSWVNPATALKDE